jgi:hypothetical protein
MSRYDHSRENFVGHLVRYEITDIAAAKDRFVQAALILSGQCVTVGRALAASLAVV